MAKFLAQKQLGALRPIDQAGEDALKRFGNAEILQVEIRQPRNINHHRKFYALMNIVYENMDTERYPSLDDFVGAIKIAAGHRVRIELPNGDVGFMPRSISFAKMTQAEFNEFYARVVDLICRWFIPGLENEALRNEVEIMVGMHT